MIQNYPEGHLAQPRRNLPCSLQMNCRHLFSTLLSLEPFIETFYYGASLPNGFRPPHGLKEVRVANALARLNTEEFHVRNRSEGRVWSEATMEAARSRMFEEYRQVGHENLNVDCQEIIQVILNAAEAIRLVDENNQAAVNQANEVR